MNKEDNNIILLNGGIESVVTFTSGDNFTFMAVGHVVASIEKNEVDIVWLFNGEQLKAPIGVRSSRYISQNLSYTRMTYHDAGIYEALLVWNMNHQCSHYYGRLSTNSRILAKSSIEVRYYGK